MWPKNEKANARPNWLYHSCLNYDISTFGTTEQEALANLKEAVELYLVDAPENSHEISEVKVGELLIA